MVKNITRQQPEVLSSQELKGMNAYLRATNYLSVGQIYLLDKLHSFPVIAMGTKFWDHLRDFIKQTLIEEQTINPGDLDLVDSTDSVDEAIALIKGKG